MRNIYLLGIFIMSLESTPALADNFAYCNRVDGVVPNLHLATTSVFNWTKVVSADPRAAEDHPGDQVAPPTLKRSLAVDWERMTSLPMYSDFYCHIFSTEQQATAGRLKSLEPSGTVYDRAIQHTIVVNTASPTVPSMGSRPVGALGTSVSSGATSRAPQQRYGQGQTRRENTGKPVLPDGTPCISAKGSPLKQGPMGGPYYEVKFENICNAEIYVSWQWTYRSSATGGAYIRPGGNYTASCLANSGCNGQLSFTSRYK